jgi:hypothetical protein
MPSLSKLSGARLWAITTYFNVAGDDRRLRNYHVFRSRLDLPLLCVELSFNGDFDLGDDDADILVRVHGGDVLWQKERLLNIALEALPRACYAVAWLDCDVLFEDPDWSRDALGMLTDLPLIQPFAQAIDLGRDQLPDETTQPDGSVAPCRSSITALVLQGKFLQQWFAQPGASMIAGYAPGFAWLARAEVMRRHGLYDGNILGNGDKLLFNAALGRCREAIIGYRMNSAQARHYLAWAKGFHESITSRIAYLPQRLFHLWHGDLVCRRYGPRVEEFNRFDFDPFVDIQHGPSGSWEWSSPKPEMHRFLHRVLISHQRSAGADISLTR